MAGGPARNTHIANDDDMSVYDCVEACCPLSFVQVPSMTPPKSVKQLRGHFGKCTIKAYMCIPPARIPIMRPRIFLVNIKSTQKSDAVIQNQQLAMIAAVIASGPTPAPAVKPTKLHGIAAQAIMQLT